MPIAGIYGTDGDPREKDPEELTYFRNAAFDTDRGAWIETSDGEIVREFDIEELREGDIEDVLDLFWDRYVGSRGFYISQESEVPGDVVVLSTTIDPEEYTDSDTVPPKDERKDD